MTPLQNPFGGSPFMATFYSNSVLTPASLRVPTSIIFLINNALISVKGC